MVRKLKSPFGVVGIVGILAGAFVFLGPLDYLLRYIHFSTLTKSHLLKEAQTYIVERAGGDQMACVYEVSCDDEGASLQLISDVESWDIEAAKKEIWRRRFSKYCAGYTANFALELIPAEGHKAEPESTALARWSFLNDRFIPKLGRFQSGSFSDRPWELCTPGKAIVR
jgi:hypothetical protein